MLYNREEIDTAKQIRCLWNSGKTEFRTFFHFRATLHEIPYTKNRTHLNWKELPNSAKTK
jgi:hypothetical protein